MSRLPITSICALLLFTACGREQEQQSAAAVADTTAAAASGPNACDLVTVADVERVLSMDLDAGETTSDYMGVSQCQFNRAASEDGAVMISLHQRGNLLNYQKVPGSSSIAGVGDAAVWNPQTNQLAVKRGEAVISISLLFSPAAQGSAAAIARTALAGLETALTTGN